MMRYMDTAVKEKKMVWEPIAGAGNLPSTNSKGENVPMALMCKVPNTFTDVLQVLQSALPGTKLYAMNLQLLEKLPFCFPAAGLDSLKGKLGFRDTANWAPHHPEFMNNPFFKGAVPPPANQ